MELKRGNTTIMLLGSADRLSVRKKIKEELQDEGFKKIIIMEEDNNLRKLDKKFASIVADEKPDFYFAIFHNNTKSINGMVFEIGWLCGNFGSENIADKLKLLLQEGYDIAGTTGYIRALFDRANLVFFNEHKPFAKCSQIIRETFSAEV